RSVPPLLPGPAAAGGSRGSHRGEAPERPVGPRGRRPGPPPRHGSRPVGVGRIVERLRRRAGGLLSAHRLSRGGLPGEPMVPGAPAVGEHLVAPGRRSRSELGPEAPGLELALLPGRPERGRPAVLPAAPRRLPCLRTRPRALGDPAGGWRRGARLPDAASVQLLRRRGSDRQPLLPAALSGVLVPGGPAALRPLGGAGRRPRRRVPLSALAAPHGVP